MRIQRHLVRSLLLLSLAVGLNALAYFGFTHGRAAHQKSRVNYNHIPPHGSHRPVSRSSRSGNSSRQSSMEVSHHDNFDGHSAPRSKSFTHPPAAALPTQYIALAQPSLASTPLAQVNVIALGSAPRAPSLGRAPPTA